MPARRTANAARLHRGENDGRTAERRWCQRPAGGIPGEDALRSRIHRQASWSITKGRYVASDLPRRLAVPQKLFGVRLWWKTIGEFSDNIGFRLELWRSEYLRPAEAFVADYNARVQETKLTLSPSFMESPTSKGAAVA
ncbi:MAG: hypothetical protein M0C28_24000 [Candidatus Moduliflexus flocculans]|nr:hypothetical protein [Candidatus Moduliflexus flocculans]